MHALSLIMLVTFKNFIAKLKSFPTLWYIITHNYVPHSYNIQVVIFGIAEQ